MTLTVTANNNADFTPAQIPQLLTQTLVFELTNWRALRFVGDGARKLLQGQTTCDFDTLSAAQALIGAQCTPKGRMIASFLATESTQQEIALILPAEQVATVQQSLSKYAPFFKVEMIEDDSQQLLGLYGEAAQSLCEQLLGGCPTEIYDCHQSDAGLAIKLAENRYLLQIANDKLATAQQLLSNQATPADQALWSLLDIRSGIGHVLAATSDEFVPQMTNLELINGVSFKKGCYTGQEVVARMHYLGKAKRRMYRLAITDAELASQLPAAGTPCYLPGKNAAAGQIVIAAPADQDRIELLAVFSDSAVESAELQIGDNTTTTAVEWLPLPYSTESD